MNKNITYDWTKKGFPYLRAHVYIRRNMVKNYFMIRWGGEMAIGERGIRIKLPDDWYGYASQYKDNIATFL